MTTEARAASRRRIGNDIWLGQVQEEILEPSLPICDAHHHLWPQADAYLADDLLRDIAGAENGGRGHRIVSTVFVECGAAYREEGPPEQRVVGETEFVEAIAARSANGATRIAAAIVPRADLALGAAVQDVLEAHLAASPQRLRGIRHVTAFDPRGQTHRSHTHPPPGLMGDARFREGFARLAPLGLCFDAWLYHPQIPELTSLARAFPETTIVLDHFGGPIGIGSYADERQDVFAFWRKAIRDLATCPNVVAKLGGLAMPVNGFAWHERERPPDSCELARRTRDTHLETIDCFGPSRCLFESNFPVDRVSCSYTTLWNSFKRLAADFAAADKAALFHDTAARVYRLDPLAARP